MTDHKPLGRRDFLKKAAFGAAFMGIAGLPKISLANADTHKRLITVILRGGMDGLAAIVPYGDSHYKSARGKLAMPENTLLQLDGFFALHPAFAPLKPYYDQGDLAIIHAVASSYRERSHFDAQNVIETGGMRPHAMKDGWLNRSLSLMPQSTSNMAVAFGQGIPLILEGAAPVGSWTPKRNKSADDALIGQIEKLYGQDPLFHTAYAQAMDLQDLVNETIGEDAMNFKMGKKNQTKEMIKMAAQLLSEDKGPRLATIEIGGWDTHANQGLENGALFNQFKSLADGLAMLSEALKPMWDDTVIMVMTEFGRTVAANGTAGSDHGTAGCCFVMGGGVNGGKVYSDWPGLSLTQLYQKRDLRPTTHLHSVTKAVLNDFMGFSMRDINNHIFTDSDAVKKLNDLIS